jgi:hypothetical protein
LNGSLVVPLFDADNNVVQAYGRKIREDLRKGTPRHLYLPGEHRGVFNLEGFMSRDGRYAGAPGDSAPAKDTEELVICEALIDALTVYRAGFKHVTASYGVNGFTEAILAAMKDNGIKRALIAYDRDAAGDAAAAKLADKLISEGIDSYRLPLPKGMDINEYALQATPASESLGRLIRNAEWMGEGKELESRSQNPEENKAEKQPQPKAKQHFERQLKEVSEQMQAVNNAEPLPAKAVPDAPQPIEAEVSEHEINLSFGSRRYRVRGFENNNSYQVMKINLLVRAGEDPGSGPGHGLHVDTFDLYHAKARNHFIRTAAVELDVDEQIIKADLGKLLLKLELLQDERLKEALKPKDKAVALSEADEAEALALLKAPDLLNRIVADIEHGGLVGEQTNSLVGYLACVSRRLDKPLAILVQSTSAAGKSSLMDAVLALMPEEERVQYSAMTGQSLFYMGETNLKHKILAIAEEEGVAQASYALKLLQSEGELTIASTAKDPQSGRLETQEYHVEGPVMLFLTTTAIDNDEELLNRCLVLSVNESREQTRAIHERQRFACTLEGMLAEHDRDKVVRVHRNAQRLLKPLKVVNPFAKHLSFVDDKTRTRRDQQKYLTLINAIALLHQHQRKIKTAHRRGEVIEYIEVELSDIEIANRLAHDVLGRTLDELPPQTRTLLGLVHDMVTECCQRESIEQSEVRFSRREVRAWSRWSDTALKVHLARLVDMEYLLIHRGRRGNAYEYELLYRGEGDQGKPFVCGLIDTDQRGYDRKRSGVKPNRSGGGQGAVSPRSGGGQGRKNGKKQNGSGTYDDPPDLAAKSTYTVQENPLSYVVEDG